jgi:hypothetical protein
MRPPSCHGDASVFSFRSKTCSGCRHFDSCVSVTHDYLQQLRPAPHIALMLERHARFDANKADKGDAGVIEGKRDLTAEEEVIASKLPVKTAPQYRRIVSEGYLPLMKRGLERGRNPFRIDGYKYLHIAFAMLLQGGFTKKSLRLHYMATCGWSEGTAFSAVSMIWHLFPAFGIATEVDGSLLPTRETNNVSSERVKAHTC